MSASTRPFSRWRVRNAYTGQRCSWVRRPAVIVLPSWGARARRNSEFGQGRRVAARVRIHGGTPGIQRPFGRVPDRADSQAPEPGGELGHQRHRECRIGHGVPVVALGAITEPFPWRVRAGGLAAPRNRHCAGRHRVPAAGRATNGIENTESGHSRRIVAGMCIHGPVLRTAVLLAGYGDRWVFLLAMSSLRRRPPGRRAIWAEASAVLLFQSPGPAPSLFWTQVSCDCFPDDCHDGPIRGPVLFPAQRLFEQEATNVGGKSHGDFLEVAALSVRPVNLYGLRACDLWRATTRGWFSDYLFPGQPAGAATAARRVLLVPASSVQVLPCALVCS